MSKKNYTGVFFPDKFITKNPKRLFRYLNSIKIKNEFDLCIFINHLRAIRPLRSFNLLKIKKLPRLHIRVNSSFQKNLSLEIKTDILWAEICRSLPDFIKLFKNKSSFECKNIKELIAIHLLSEFMEYPVLCYWDENNYSQNCLKKSSNLEGFFPWESQLCVHICKNTNDEEFLLNNGLNPQLIINLTKENIDFENILKKFINVDSISIVKKYLKHIKNVNSSPPDHLFLRKPYLMGLNKLAYLSRKISIFTSLGFFKEEQLNRKLFFDYLRNKIKEKNLDHNSELKSIAYQAIGALFLLKSNKKITIVSDCSFAFRHRSKQDLLHMHFTELELKGIIDKIIDSIYSKQNVPENTKDPSDDLWNFKDSPESLIKKLTNNTPLRINDSNKIIQKLQDIKIPLFYFLDNISIESLILYVLNPIKTRINKNNSAPVYLFSSENKILRGIIGRNDILKKAINIKLLKIIKTNQLTRGIDLLRLGTKNLNLLVKNRKNGLICSYGEEGLITSFNLAMPWINLGVIKSESLSAISGLKRGEGYAIINENCKKLFIGFPAINKSILDNYSEQLNLKKGLEIKNKNVNFKIIETENKDNTPLSGIITRVTNKNYNLDIAFSNCGNSIEKIIKKYELDENKNVILGCNGGYFLDDRLTKERKFSDILLNSPLGLLKIKNNIISLPLFNNRPALAIDYPGKLTIEKIDLKKLTIYLKFSDKKYCLNSNQINSSKLKKEKVALYTVEKSISIVPKGYTCIKFIFNRVIEILNENKESTIKNPSYALLIPNGDLPNSLKINSRISFDIPEYDKFYSMIEAGPLLIKNGSIALDIKKEKWDLPESKIFQFAEVHSKKLRTARTVICKLKNNEFAIITINSRTIESVGATHLEVANMIKKEFKNKIIDAMEFDSGGSVYLWADSKLKSICCSLKNDKKNDELIYYPRSISTAILLSKN